eukprot:990450-Rhodomonas_salina.1
MTVTHKLHISRHARVLRAPQLHHHHDHDDHDAHHAACVRLCAVGWRSYSAAPSLCVEIWTARRLTRCLAVSRSLFTAPHTRALSNGLHRTPHTQSNPVSYTHLTLPTICSV